MLYLKGALSSGFARYDVALCLISMTEPVGGGINETQSHGEADSPRACSVKVAARPNVVRELLRITPTTEVRYSLKEVTDIRRENMLDEGYTHG
jgi:hypothetical protein